MALLPYDAEETEEFFVKFLATDLGARMNADGLLTARNTRKLVKQAQEDAGHEDITLAEFSRTAQEMYWQVLLDGQEEVVEISASAPKPLTASQQAWMEYRIYVNGHNESDCAYACHDPKVCTVKPHSVAECKARAQKDPGFQKFLHTNIVREFAEQPVGDAVENLNDKKPTAKGYIPADVKQFAEDYRTMSVAQARSLMSPGIAGEVVAAHYQKLFDAACAAGLI